MTYPYWMNEVILAASPASCWTLCSCNLLGQLFTRLPSKEMSGSSRAAAAALAWRPSHSPSFFRKADSVLCPGPVFVSRKLDMRMPCGTKKIISSGTSSWVGLMKAHSAV